MRDVYDDIVAVAVLPYPADALFPGSPAGSLTVRHHRPKYDTITQADLVAARAPIDPDEIPDDSQNPERLAARSEELEQAHASFSKMVDRHVGALTPLERKILEERFGHWPDMLDRIRKVEDGLGARRLRQKKGGD